MEAALIGIAALLLLIFLRVPIAIALGLVGFVGWWSIDRFQTSLYLLGQTGYQSVLSFDLAVVPLFILMGNLIARARLSEELYRAAYAFLGHYRGGLAMATISACGAFGAVTGSSLATAATMARVAMPSMRKYGYDDGFAAGSIAAGGTLGILIPPSIMLVIYGIITNSDIGKLFAAGILPGVLGILLYGAAARLVVARNPAAGPAGERTAWPERGRALTQVWGMVLLFALVMGGIYTGQFTATEAAGVGAFGAFLFALYRRALTLRRLYDSLLETSKTTAALFAVLIGATLFSEFINRTGVHTGLVEWVNGMQVPPIAVVFVIVGIYLLLGTVLESLSLILLTVPLFYPIVVTNLGYDPIWYGIIVVVAVEIGLITPPIGVNVFVLRAMLPDVSTATLFRGVTPFWLADIVRITILVLFPAIALVLPDLFF